MKNTYDVGCFELAKSFIEDSECPDADPAELARDIQQTIEDFFFMQQRMQDKKNLVASNYDAPNE